MHVLTEQDNRPPANQIYSDYIYSRRTDNLATDLWGEVPRTLGEAAKILPKIRAEYSISPELETLQRIMKKNLKRLGVLTGKTAEAIDAMSMGVVEGGQQPMLMGGPSLILNKIAYSASLA